MNYPLELTQRPDSASGNAAAPRQSGREFARTCRELIEEANAFGLTLDDLIEALRRHSTHSNNPN